MYQGFNKEETQVKLFTSNGSSGSYTEPELLASTDSAKKRQRTYSRWSPIEEGVTLAWDNLSVYTSEKKNKRVIYKRIINGVTGAVKAGSLVAIMGSSGAGKSTLMSALAHRTTAKMVIDGNILINGRQIGSYMKFMSGFMHQEDMLLPYLTVREHMNIMANLKLDRRISKQDKNILIHDILQQLGLMKCRNSKIGGIDQAKALSGGEKKRLAFATELLTDPPILFCDEPTTGLDSYSAQKLVTMMNLMSITGKTILCTIHQPSSDIFAMFSQLILVADGRIAYMGSTNNALGFFERMGYMCPTSFNPADFYIKTLATAPGYEDNSRQTIKRICDEFAVSDYAKEVEIVVQYELHMGRAVTENLSLPTSQSHSLLGELKDIFRNQTFLSAGAFLLPPMKYKVVLVMCNLFVLQHKKFELRRNFKEILWISKLYWLTYRWFLEILRNPALEAMKISQRMLIGFIVGFCYLGTDALTQNGVQSVEGIIFMFVSENTFNPMYSVLNQFPAYLPLFLREYKSGLYHPSTYYLSRVLSLIPGFILEPFTFVITAYWLAGLRTTGYAFLMTLTTITLTMNVSSACGIMFSNAFDSMPTALAYLVPFDYVHMITSGVFVKLSTLPIAIAWVKYLSWLMYSTEALTILQWGGVTNITCGNLPEGVPCIRNGLEVLERYDFSENALPLDIFGMLILLFSFYTLGYFFLWRRVRHH